MKSILLQLNSEPTLLDYIFENPLIVLLGFVIVFFLMSILPGEKQKDVDYYKVLYRTQESEKVIMVKAKKYKIVKHENASGSMGGLVSSGEYSSWDKFVKVHVIGGEKLLIAKQYVFSIKPVYKIEDVRDEVQKVV